MFQRILVPVDFSDGGARGLQTALRLALLDGGSVTLLHVIEVVEHIPFSDLERFYARLERSARTKMRGLLAPFLRAKVPASAKILYGKRAVEIVKYALNHRNDLILMSAHRIHPARAGEEWATVSAKVCLLSPTSILLVK